MVYDPIRDILNRYGPQDPDDEPSLFDRIQAKGADVGASIMGALRSTAQRFATDAAAGVNQWRENDYAGSSMLGGLTSQPGYVQPDPLRPVDVMGMMRGVSSPVQSIAQMGADILGPMEHMPGVSGQIRAPLEAIAGLPDQIFGTPESFDEQGVPDVTYGQAATDLGTEAGAIMAGGPLVGRAAGMIAPRIPSVATAGQSAGRVERVMRALANAPQRAAQVTASEAPATRMGGFVRDALRYAPVEGGLAATNPERSTVAMFGEMADLKELLDSLPEEERPAAAVAMANFYERTYGRLPEGMQDFLRENPVGRALAELPMTTAFAPFGAFDADVVTRRIPDSQAAREAIEYRGGYQGLTPGERQQARAAMLQDQPVFDQPQIGPGTPPTPSLRERTAGRAFDSGTDDPVTDSMRRLLARAQDPGTPEPTVIPPSGEPIPLPGEAADPGDVAFARLAAETGSDSEDAALYARIVGGLDGADVDTIESVASSGNLPVHVADRLQKAADLIAFGRSDWGREIIKSMAEGFGLRSGEETVSPIRTLGKLVSRAEAGMTLPEVRGMAAVRLGRLMSHGWEGGQARPMPGLVKRLLPKLEHSVHNAIYLHPSQKGNINRAGFHAFRGGGFDGGEGTRLIPGTLEVGPVSGAPEGSIPVAYNTGMDDVPLLALDTEDDLLYALGPNAPINSIMGKDLTPGERADLVIGMVEGNFEPSTRPFGISVSPEVMRTPLGRKLFGENDTGRVLLTAPPPSLELKPNTVMVDNDGRPLRVKYPGVRLGPGEIPVNRRDLNDGSVYHIADPKQFRAKMQRALGAEELSKLEAEGEGFFASRLEEVIDKLGDSESTPKGTRGRFPNGTTGEKWLNALRREQFNPREMEFRSLDRFLQENADRHLTRDDIMEYLKGEPDGRLKLEVARLGQDNLAAPEQSGLGDPRFARMELLAEDLANMQNRALSPDEMSDLMAELNELGATEAFASVPGQLRAEPSRAFTNGIDIFTEMRNGNRVYIGTFAPVEGFSDFDTGLTLPDIPGFALEDLMDQSGILKSRQGFDRQVSDRAVYGTYSHPSVKDHSEYVVVDPDGDYPDPAHWSDIDGGRPVHVRMGSMEVEGPDGSIVKARFVGEIQGTSAQRSQQRISEAERIIRYERDVVKEMERRIVRDEKWVRENPEALPAEISKMRGSIFRSRANIDRALKNISLQEATLKEFKRVGGGSQPRRAMTSEDMLPTGDWPLKTHHPFQQTSDFAGLGAAISLRDAANSGEEMLVVTPGEIARKYATGAAETLRQISGLAWYPERGVLTAFGKAGEILSEWKRGSDFQSLSEVVTPQMLKELEASPGGAVEATMENMAPPRGGMDVFYDDIVVGVYDAMLRRLGLDVSKVKTKVTVPAVPGEQAATPAVAYRMTDEVRKAMQSAKFRMLGVGGLATLGAIDYELGEDNDLATPMMAMAMMGVPGGPKILKGAAKAKALPGTVAATAGARAGLTAAGIGRAFFRAGKYAIIGGAAGGGLSQMIWEEEPGTAFLVGALIGAGVSIRGMPTDLKRLAYADSPVIREMGGPSGMDAVEQYLKAAKNDPKATLKATWTAFGEAFSAGSHAMRQGWFDELAILDRLKWRKQQLVADVERGVQEGPIEEGVFWPDPDNLLEGDQAMLPKPGVPEDLAQNLRVSATSPVDWQESPVSAAAVMRRQERLNLLQQLKDEAEELVRRNPEISPESARQISVDRVLGKAASELEQLERHARLLRGSRGYGERTLRKGVMVPGDENPRTRGFVSLLEEIGPKINDLRLYGVARRVRHLEETGRANLVPVQYAQGSRFRADLDAALERADPDVVKVFEEMQDINREWLRAMEEEGVLRAGSADRILSSVGDNYFPFFRDVEYAERESLLSRATSLTKKGNVLHKMVGSDKELPVMDPLESFARLHYQFTNAIFRQRAAKSLAAVVPHLDPSQIRRLRPQDILMDVKASVKDFTNLTASQKRQLDELLKKWQVEDRVGNLVGKENVDDFLEEFQRATGMSEEDLFGAMPPGTLDLGVVNPGKLDRVIRIFDNDGQAVYYKVLDDHLWQGLHGADPFESQSSIIMGLYKAGEATSRLLRTFTTSTPQFQIANFLRDTSFAAISSQAKSDNFLLAIGQAYTDAIGGLSVVAMDVLPAMRSRAFAGSSVGGLAGSSITYESDDKLDSILMGLGAGGMLGGGAGMLAGPLAKRYTKSLGMSPEQVMNLFSNIGAQQAAFQTMDLKNIAKGVREAMNRHNAGRGTILNSLMHPFEALRLAGIAAENSNRVGEFVRAMKNEKNAAGSVSMEGIEVAGAGARDVTVDFSRKGAEEAVQFLRPIASFWGAGMQSVDKLRRMLQTNPKRVAQVGFMSITAPSLFLYYHNRENPEYWDVPDWIKTTTWSVPKKWLGLGESGFIHIPKPFELGIVFGSLPEQILEAMDKKGGIVERLTGEEAKNPNDRDESLGDTFVSELLGGLVDSMTPEITMIQPLWENITNRDFTGLPIVSPFDVASNVPDYLQGYEDSSQMARWLADITNRVSPGDGISPAHIDNAIQGWGGTITRQLVTSSSRWFRDEEKYGESPSIPRSDRFVARRFQSRSSSSNTPAVNTFYEDLNRGEVLYRELNSLDDLGRTDEAWEIARKPENQRLLQQLSDFRNVAEEIKSLRDLRKEVESTPQLDASEKRKWIEYYNKMIDLTAKRALDWGN